MKRPRSGLSARDWARRPLPVTAHGKFIRRMGYDPDFWLLHEAQASHFADICGRLARWCWCPWREIDGPKSRKPTHGKER